MILMYTPKEAHAVQSKLNNHVFRGVLVSAAIKSSWDLCQKLGRQKGGGRLLVRNLGFDVRSFLLPLLLLHLLTSPPVQITIPDLRAAFARFGSLHSVTLPIDPKTNKPRGFAFIYYVGKPMAEAALKGVNGTRIYSGMAAERIASEGGKEGKKKEVREKKKAEKAQFQGGGGEKGRVVAVDWALSKEEWEKAQEEAKAAASASGSDSGSDSDSEEDSDEEDEDSDMTPVPEGDESEEEDDDSDTDPIPVGLDNDGQNEEKDSEDEESEDEKPKQEGTTLFVRNMSFEATEAELYDLCVLSFFSLPFPSLTSPFSCSFKSFGPVRYARIVYDPTTKRSRGTAFVCFWNEEHAWEVLRASRALNEGNFGEVRSPTLPFRPPRLVLTALLRRLRTRGATSPSSWPIRVAQRLLASPFTAVSSLPFSPSRRATPTSFVRTATRRVPPRPTVVTSTSCARVSSSLRGLSPRPSLPPTWTLVNPPTTPARVSSVPTPPSTSPAPVSRSVRSPSTSRTVCSSVLRTTPSRSSSATPRVASRSP